MPDETFPPGASEVPAQGDFMEAAGIEPARGLAAKPSISRDFSKAPSYGDRNFVAGTNICGLGFEVRREGKHANLHVFDFGVFWHFEELSAAIPKLEALLSAARLAEAA